VPIAPTVLKDVKATNSIRSASIESTLIAPGSLACHPESVNERIHDNEPDTGEAVVRSLLQAECPHWANAPIEYLRTSGTDNAMWRLRVDHGPDLVVRLPRRPGAAAGVLQEVAVLQRIEGSLGSVRTLWRHWRPTLCSMASSTAT